MPSTELQKIGSTFTQQGRAALSARRDHPLAENTFAIADLGTNLTGFLGAEVRCSKPATLYITFDEILTKDDVDSKRLGCVNAVCYELQPGTYRLESFEPYTMRYLKLNVLAGDCEVKGLYLREYANPETDEAQFSCSDPGLNRIFDAARQTFRQNAVDIFMDCPSRERAGWLCDSFFTVPRRVRPVRQHDHREELLRELPPAAEASPTCPKACCPCATRPITTTASSSRTGRSGS